MMEKIIPGSLNKKAIRCRRKKKKHLLESQSLSSSWSGMELRKALRSFACGLGVLSSLLFAVNFPLPLLPRISWIINFDRGGWYAAIDPICVCFNIVISVTELKCSVGRFMKCGEKIARLDFVLFLSSQSPKRANFTVKCFHGKINAWTSRFYLSLLLLLSSLAQFITFFFSPIMTKELL